MGEYRRSKATGILFHLMSGNPDLLGRERVMAFVAEGDGIGGVAWVLAADVDRLFGEPEDA